MKKPPYVHRFIYLRRLGDQPLTLERSQSPYEARYKYGKRAHSKLGRPLPFYEQGYVFFFPLLDSRVPGRDK